MSVARAGVLHEEHVLLGAELAASDHAGVLCVRSYARESAGEGATVLADLTGAVYLLVSGADAPAFCSATFAGARLGVGETAVEAALSGTGELISAPLLVRTGDLEYVVVDLGPRQEALAAWVDLLAGAGRDGRRAFPELDVTDASGMLVPLLLSGPAAEHVLGDYLHNGEALPAAGTVAQLRLDAISTVVAHVAVPFAPPTYLVLVPVSAARILWRSLLSFTEVTPVGHDRLRAAVARICPWFAGASEDGPVRASRAELETWGLVRGGADPDFVGGRSLR